MKSIVGMVKGSILATVSSETIGWKYWDEAMKLGRFEVCPAGPVEGSPGGGRSGGGCPGEKKKEEVSKKNKKEERRRKKHNRNNRSWFKTLKHKFWFNLAKMVGLAKLGFGQTWFWPDLVLAKVGFGQTWFGQSWP